MSKELFYDWMGGNDVLFQGINNIRGETYDQVMHYASWAADPAHFNFYIGALAIFALLMIFFRLITSHKGTWYYTTSWIGVFAVLFAANAANEIYVKQVGDYFGYPRPYVAFPVEEIKLLEATTPQEDFRSLPSAHVTFATILVGALWPVLAPGLGWFGFFFILLVGWSRISLGMHFPADVLGSMLMATPLIILLREILYFLFRKILRIKC